MHVITAPIDTLVRERMRENVFYLVFFLIVGLVHAFELVGGMWAT